MAGNYRRYPWTDWFGLTQVELRKGRDYEGRMDSFIQQCRNAAHKYGVSISIVPDEEGQSFLLKIMGVREEK